MVLDSSLGLAITLVPGDNKGHLDQYGPSGSMARGPELPQEVLQPTRVSMSLKGNRSCR